MKAAKIEANIVSISKLILNLSELNQFDEYVKCELVILAHKIQLNHAIKHTEYVFIKSCLLRVGLFSTKVDYCLDQVL